MTRLTILEYPDPRLRTKALPVGTVDAPLRDLIDDMLETMYAAKGIGLAATQINVHQRLLVADISEARNSPRVFINPEILSRDGAETSQEGCLSVPGYYDDVERAARIRVRALDRDGKASGERIAIADLPAGPHVGDVRDEGVVADPGGVGVGVGGEVEVDVRDRKSVV